MSQVANWGGAVIRKAVKRMNPFGCFSRMLPWMIGASVALLVSGCGNIFVAKHKVLVDAICAPGATKPSGQSYRLLAKKSMVSQSQMQVPVVKACVDAALVGQGMYEPPPNVAPDIFIEVGYGTDTSGRLDPASRETYLQLSARENSDRAVDRGTGPELWDVRVAVLGIAGRVESAMPLLSAVAVNYIATDTHVETKIDIPQNSPMIAAVRDNAIKSLEAKAAAPSAQVPANAGAPPAAGTPAGPATGNPNAAAKPDSAPVAR